MSLSDDDITTKPLTAQGPADGGAHQAPDGADGGADAGADEGVDRRPAIGPRDLMDGGLPAHD